LSYKKVGGLHFVRIGRFGFSFFFSKKGAERAKRDLRRKRNLARLRAAASMDDYFANFPPIDVDGVTSRGNFPHDMPSYNPYFEK
jgi:hypothetical protein